MISASAFPRIDDTGQLASRRDVLGRPSAAPISPGVYAWYFKRVPPGIDATGCLVRDGLTLLYVGISPTEPPTNGRAPSRSNLRQRLRTHYAGNAAGSTLRKTLGCLLEDDLGFALRRVGSGERLTFTNPGERLLDTWLEENALVTWVVSERPWEVEREVLRSGVPLPLNIRDNPCPAHTELLSGVRRRAVAAALALPIIGDGGGARRARMEGQ